MTGRHDPVTPLRARRTHPSLRGCHRPPLLVGAPRNRFQRDFSDLRQTAAKRQVRKIPGRRLLRQALLRRRQGDPEFPGELRQDPSRRGEAKFALLIAPVLALAQPVGQLTPGATTLGDCRSEPLDTVRMETVKSNLHTPKVASPIHGINYYLTKGAAVPPRFRPFVRKASTGIRELCAAAESARSPVRRGRGVGAFRFSARESACGAWRYGEDGRVPKWTPSGSLGDRGGQLRSMQATPQAIGDGVKSNSRRGKAASRIFRRDPGRERPAAAFANNPLFLMAWSGTLCFRLAKSQRFRRFARPSSVSGPCSPCGGLEFFRETGICRLTSVIFQRYCCQQPCWRRRC